MAKHADRAAFHRLGRCRIRAICQISHAITPWLAAPYAGSVGLRIEYGTSNAQDPFDQYTFHHHYRLCDRDHGVDCGERCVSFPRIDGIRFPG